MTTEDITRLLTEEQELEKLLSEKREARLKLESKQKELESYNVQVEELNESDKAVWIRTSLNDKLLDILNSVKGKDYIYGRSKIPLTEWTNFHNKLLDSGFSVNYPDGMRVRIQLAVNTENKRLSDLANLPNLVIKITPDRKYISAVVKPEYQHEVTLNVNGAIWYRTKSEYIIPISEGYKFYNNVKEIPNTHWAEGVQELIVEQIESKARLDEIALMVDTEKPYTDFQNDIEARPFQNVGMTFLEAAGYSGINGDEMGLGKTLQAIGVTKKFKKVVVIPPATLKYNWVREFRKLLNEDVTVLSGRVPTMQDFEKVLVDPRPRIIIINYDILSSSTEVAKPIAGFAGGAATEERYQWVELINLYKPDVIICDEAHGLRNKDSKKSKASRKLECKKFICLTGTPVMNRPGDLWPMLTLVRPELFPSYDQFIRTYTYGGKELHNAAEFRELLKSIMIRRVKSDVLKDLPPINRINEYFELDERAQGFYNKAEAGLFRAMETWNMPDSEVDEREIPNVLAKIMRLKQICAIATIEKTTEKAIAISDSAEPDKNKVIIFTQFKSVAYRIAQLLGNESLVMTGDQNGKQREDIKSQFINDPSKKFLVGIEDVLGEGHNLEVAWNVIFNDFFWTPFSHYQCEGRAYGRLSNAHHIESYWMIAAQTGGKDTIVQWILELLQSKLDMSIEATENLSSDRQKSILKDLLVRVRKEMRKK